MSSNFKKMNNAMKVFWLAIAVVSLIIVVVMGFRDGWDRWVYYLVFPGIALLMYLFRRFAGNRIADNMEKDKNKRQENK